MIAVRHRAAALLSGVLAFAAATLALPSPAQAAVAGFKVTITQLPDEFEAGANARTVQVVASTDNAGRCRKVRWSMVLKVDGVDLDQVKVTRVEDNADFPLQVRADGDTARLTDVRFDPGSLCRGKTVTAVYQVAFDDDAAGKVTFQAQVFDAATRLLEEASASSRVVGERAEPSPSPSASPSPSEEAEPPAPEESAVAGDEPEGAAAPPAGTVGDDLSANPVSSEGGVPSLLGPGLIIGALLVFAGMGLLLRIRLRNRAPKHQQMPTGFYPTH
jgi:hypothetical protein